MKNQPPTNTTPCVWSVGVKPLWETTVVYSRPKLENHHQALNRKMRRVKCNGAINGRPRKLTKHFILSYLSPLAVPFLFFTACEAKSVKKFDQVRRSYNMLKNVYFVIFGTCVLYWICIFRCCRLNWRIFCDSYTSINTESSLELPLLFLHVIVVTWNIFPKNTCDKSKIAYNT